MAKPQQECLAWKKEADLIGSASADLLRSLDEDDLFGSEGHESPQAVHGDACQLFGMPVARRREHSSSQTRGNEAKAHHEPGIEGPC